MINIIWGLFIITGIIYSLLTNNIDIINNQILMSGKKTIEMV